VLLNYDQRVRAAIRSADSPRARELARQGAELFPAYADDVASLDACRSRNGCCVCHGNASGRQHGSRDASGYQCRECCAGRGCDARRVLLCCRRRSENGHSTFRIEVSGRATPSHARRTVTIIEPVYSMEPTHTLKRRRAEFRRIRSAIGC
jgi:hypothetical protein